MLSISEVAMLAGISTRTLRYYEQKGLISSARSAGNYRVYDQSTIDRLQKILFFKYFGFELAEIKRLLDLPENKQLDLLGQQRLRLIEQQQQLQLMLTSLDETLKWRKGEITMSNEEKFEALKAQKLAENESKYGEEIRQKYGEDTVNASNDKFGNFTEQEMARFEAIQIEIGGGLNSYIIGGQKDEELDKKIFDLHKEFLIMSWPSYSAEAHRGLGNMYVADDRFAKYYQDATGEENAAVVLNSIIQKYAK